MKRGGILNPALAGALAGLGHTDLVVVCDVGLPLPPGPCVVDLAFRLGEPPLAGVLTGMVEELVVEGGFAAEEVVTRNPDCHRLFTALVPRLTLVTHEEFKGMLPGARLVVRTGEATPYANVALRCGVPF